LCTGDAYIPSNTNASYLWDSTLAAPLLFYLFLGNLSRRVEASKDKAGRGSGRDSRLLNCSEKAKEKL